MNTVERTALIRILKVLTSGDLRSKGFGLIGLPKRSDALASGYYNSGLLSVNDKNLQRP